MPFDLTTTGQTSELEHAVKRVLYKSIYESAIESKRNKRWIKLTGLPVGIVSGLLTIAKRIARFAECILKGIINLCGAPFSKSCHAITGLKQLFLEAPLQLIVRLPLSITMLVFSIPFKAISFATSPKAYVKSLWIDHDLVEKQIQIEAPKIAIFEKAEKDLSENEEDVVALTTLADCCYRGYGTDIDLDKAIEFYNKAADLDDAHSMKMLGDIYEKDDKALSIEWYQKASEAGDLDASFKMGLHHYGIGRQASINKAIAFFKQAAQSGHVLSKACLLELLPPDEAADLHLTCSAAETAEAKSYLGLK